jgi:hypothetical protein
VTGMLMPIWMVLALGRDLCLQIHRSVESRRIVGSFSSRSGTVLWKEMVSYE